VLDAMTATGDITAAEAAAAQDAPLDTVAHQVEDEVTSPGSAYFVEYVRQWAIDQFGEDSVYGGGLQISTTLDPRLQTAAEQAVAGVLDRPDDPAAALVSVDASGAIRALVGGRDFATNEVDYALGAQGGGTGRQPGSTFKPFVLAAAIEAGVPLDQTFAAPPAIELETDSGPWKVSNYGGESFGHLDLAEATASSVNTVYAQLMQLVGPDKVADLANRVGIESDLDPVPSLVLGTEEVSPLEMASSYMTFARRGTRIDPFAVTKVTDAGGEVAYEAHPDAERVMDEGDADGVNAVLRGVIDHGTGTAADIGVDAAGKTGTTQEYGDAWFVGYTPAIGAAVWMGYPEGSAHAMTAVHDRKVTGGSFPAQIWQRYMAAAVDGIDSGTFTEPPRSVFAGSSSASTVSTSPIDTLLGSSSSTSSSSSSSSSSSTSSTSEPPPTSTTEEPTTSTEPPTTDTTSPPTTTADATTTTAGGGP
jgi:penicillin-binding protein 1A